MESSVERDELTRCIEHAERFASQIGDAVNGAALGDDLRSRISRLLWQQVVEDGLAFPSLVRARYVGSARALLRPQFEALVRSAWVVVLATDKQLSHLANGTRQPEPIGKLVKRLNEHPKGWEVRAERVPFADLWDRGADAFHDTAHRGTRAISRLARANQGDEHYVDDDEVALLYLAGANSGIAGAAMLEAVGNRDAASEIGNRASEFRAALEATMGETRD